MIAIIRDTGCSSPTIWWVAGIDDGWALIFPIGVPSYAQVYPVDALIISDDYGELPDWAQVVKMDSGD